MISRLGFLEGTSYPEAQCPNEVLLMGGLDRHITERLKSLVKLGALAAGSSEEISLCYLTGPRGGSNLEPLAPIIADWFGDES